MNSKHLGGIEKRVIQDQETMQEAIMLGKSAYKLKVTWNFITGLVESGTINGNYIFRFGETIRNDNNVKLVGTETDYRSEIVINSQVREAVKDKKYVHLTALKPCN